MRVFQIEPVLHELPGINIFLVELTKSFRKLVYYIYRQAHCPANVPNREPWYPAFKSELLAFPSGKHDDQVDAIALVGQLLDQMVAGRNPPKDEPVKRDAYREARDERFEDSTATL